jgi:uncharacterized protein
VVTNRTIVMWLSLRIYVFAAGLLAALLPAHGKEPKMNWHQSFDWKAENYFAEPEVIALCHAIEARDLKHIDKLVASGVDVNAKGKWNMTPLLWAFPDDNRDCFCKLLELGADPNLVVESDFNTKMSGIRPGDSVTHLACSTIFTGYFDCVFRHGGDPNLRHRKTHDTPLFLLIRGPAKDKEVKVRRLIELGADLDANKEDDYTGGITPPMVATSCFGQYAIALQLLKAGADYKVTTTNGMRLIHIVLAAEKRKESMAPEQKEDYLALVNWLEDHGESLEDARKDIKRLRSSDDRAGRGK